MGTCLQGPPAFIIKRLPVRFTFDNNYFNDRYQGIPIGGYTKIIEKMLDGIEVKTDTDYFEFIKENPDIAEKDTVYRNDRRILRIQAWSTGISFGKI